MPYSTCCGAHTNFTEIGICPECLDHCDWEEDEEDEEEKQLDEETERAIEQEQINKQ